MNVCVVGTGYVGLVTGACLADVGHQVTCVDTDRTKISGLLKREMPIYEPGLDDVVSRNAEVGRLRFSTDLPGAAADADVVMIAVGTPSRADGSADVSAVMQVAADVGRSLDRYKVIVTKSTAPVGTGEEVRKTIAQAASDRDFDIAANPEFLREGSAVSDFMSPDRIVVGVSSGRAAKVMTELYEPIDAPRVLTDVRSAELIKYASNAFLATKISFANALSNLCEKVGADVEDVTVGIGLDKRIGSQFLKVGPGFGGSCFPKDLRALIKTAEERGYDFRLLKEVTRINEEQRKLVVRKAEKLTGGLSGKAIGALGLAFKANTDDTRESPAADVIKMFLDGGARVKVFDPAAMDNARAILKRVEFRGDAYEVAEGSDLLAILTEWEEFTNLDFARIKKAMRNPVILDARNCLDPAKLAPLGFTYEGIGR